MSLPVAEHKRNGQPLLEVAHFSCAYHFEEEDRARWSRWGYDNWFSTRQ